MGIILIKTEGYMGLPRYFILHSCFLKLDLYSASSLKTVCGQTCRSIWIYFPDSKTISLWFEQQGWIMVFNTKFNNISFISWWSVLLMEETRVTGKNTNLLRITDKLYHIMLYPVHLAMSRIRTHNGLVVIYTDCIGSCKSNYHMIMTTTMNNMMDYRCK